MNLTELLAKRATGSPDDMVTISLHTLDQFTQRVANKGLLDEFAMAALPGICANKEVHWLNLESNSREIAEVAYCIAEACMEARKWTLSNGGKR